MEKFTVEEIKKYILSQDSFGDVLYNLNAENIEEANKDDKVECVGCGNEVEPVQFEEGERCPICSEYI